MQKFSFETFKNHFFDCNFYNDNYKFLVNSFNCFFNINIFENDTIFWFLNDNFLINDLSINDIKKIYLFFKNKIKLF